MMNSDLSAFRDLYITTSLENISLFKEAIAKLISNVKDVFALEQAYRSIHTLKSKSMVMGFKNTGAISDVIEDRLYAAKNGTNMLTYQEVKVLKEIGEKIHKSIAAIKTKDKEFDFSEEISKFGP